MHILVPVLDPGSKLGRYEIRSQLGAGGMGEVYLALDTRLSRSVALKILPDEVATDPDRMRRFEHEAKAASGLNHPNIITIYEIDHSGARSFIATEFIEGSTLRERLRRQPMPPAEALNVAIQVASALAAAHASGIVHRDIKPENAILRADGIVKVLDFGLAKSTVQEPAQFVDGDAPTRTRLVTDAGVVMGTATYVSPEQARGEPVDARTDIFSLGVMLYELASGRLPFEGASVYEIVAGILSDREAAPLSRYAPDTPPELERIVGKALRKSRDERYQTAKDLLLDLQSLRQRLEFDRAYPTTPPGTDGGRAVAGGRGSRRMFIGVACATVVLVLGASAFGYEWWNRAYGSPAAIKSLAVLPLKSLDGADDYLGLGIADAEIRRMSQTGRLIVRPTSAVRRYLKEDTSALEAAKALEVDSVLEGSFQRADNRLRVSVNLLRCSDGASMWSDSFDIDMADIFTVQDTVAQQVASRLRLQLDTSQQAQLTKRYTSSAVAYEFYLKGAYNFDQRMRDPAQMLDSTISFYNKAIEADPQFALAHAQLAYAYANLAVFLDPTQPAWVDHAKAEINRAQELDPQLAETHLAKFQLLYSEFDGYQGEAAAREALLANQLNPNVGHEELAYMYTHLGLEDLARRELARALEINPTSEQLVQTKLLQYEVQSRWDEYAADKDFERAGRVTVLYQMAKGRLRDAQKALDDWVATKPVGQDQLVSTKALLHGAQGDFHTAEAEVPGILAMHPQKDPLYHHVTYDIACIYAMQGKSDEAVKWLRESAVSGFHLYPRYTRDPFLDHIRQSPAFIQFLAEMKAENDQYRRQFS
jgi:eukaryotic-like serine/threonine-protein kinase